MVPVTNHQRSRRQELSKFLLNGFADFTELEKALFEANPNMTHFERNMVMDTLGRVKSFLGRTEHS